MQEFIKNYNYVSDGIESICSTKYNYTRKIPGVCKCGLYLANKETCHGELILPYIEEALEEARKKNPTLFFECKLMRN